MGEQDPQHRAGLPRWIREVMRGPGLLRFHEHLRQQPRRARAGTRSIALGNLGNDRRRPTGPAARSQAAPTAGGSCVELSVRPRDKRQHQCLLSGHRAVLHPLRTRGLAAPARTEHGDQVRCIGNQNLGQTFEWNINGSENWNILENGFYQEFQKAQANLRANVAAGRTPSFAHTGAGKSPLPIFMPTLR